MSIKKGTKTLKNSTTTRFSNAFYVPLSFSKLKIPIECGKTQPLTQSPRSLNFWMFGYSILDMGKNRLLILGRLTAVNRRGLKKSTG